MKWDTILLQLIKFIWGSWSADPRTDTELSPFFKVKDDLSYVDGLSLRADLLFLLNHCDHTSLCWHKDFTRVIHVPNRLRERYWLLRMDCDVEAQPWWKIVTSATNLTSRHSLARYHCSLSYFMLGLGKMSPSTSSGHSEIWLRISGLQLLQSTTSRNDSRWPK